MPTQRRKIRTQGFPQSGFANIGQHDTGPRARIVENLDLAPRKIVKCIRVRPISERLAPRLEHCFLSSPTNGQMCGLIIMLDFGTRRSLPQFARGKQRPETRTGFTQLFGKRCNIHHVVPYPEHQRTIRPRIPANFRVYHSFMLPARHELDDCRLPGNQRGPARRMLPAEPLDIARTSPKPPCNQSESQDEIKPQPTAQILAESRLR